MVEWENGSNGEKEQTGNYIPNAGMSL